MHDECDVPEPFRIFSIGKLITRKEEVFEWVWCGWAEDLQMGEETLIPIEYDGDEHDFEGGFWRRISKAKE